MFLAYLKAEVIRPPSKVDPRMSEASPERERVKEVSPPQG
jgi:hypothetical protein